MAARRNRLLLLCAAALALLAASGGAGQQFDPESLPQGTWSNKVAGSFANGLDGWTCSGGEMLLPAHASSATADRCMLTQNTATS